MLTANHGGQGDCSVPYLSFLVGRLKQERDAREKQLVLIRRPVPKDRMSTAPKEITATFLRQNNRVSSIHGRRFPVSS